MSSGRRGWRRLATGFAVFAALIGVVAAIGSLVPLVPLIGILAAVLTGFFALHLVLLTALGAVSALLALRLGAHKWALVSLIVNAIAAVSLLVPLTAQVNAAKQAGVGISWGAHLRAMASSPRAAPARTAQYATVDGKKLELDIYDPMNRGAPSTPVVMIHGGGFVHGHRSDGRDWDRWFAERGYTVFDVDYRLTPPVTWNLAAQDVACALSWIRQHEKELNVVAAHALIVGQSAGASLALQVAYGVGDDSVRSSCGGTVDAPVAVFALYPAEDFRLAWAKNLKLGPVDGQDINTGYIGGSPETFPERYRAVSAIDHVRPGLPPTMVAYGVRDHLVPISGHAELHSGLVRAGVSSVLLEIPYSDHGYDLVWGSLGAQITRHVLSSFLSAHCPPTPPLKVEGEGTGTATATQER